MLRAMPATQDIPALDQVIADLRVLRERGLVRLRHTDLPALRQIAAMSGVVRAAAGGPGAVEALLRAAVDNLGGGELGASATATFGLGRGMRDRPAQIRRRSAALAYNISVERFRKYHERIVLEQVAEEVLKFPAAGQMPGRRESPRPDFTSQTVLACKVGDINVTIVVHVELAELISGIDIVVAPTNVYLELPQYYKSSVSAAVRRAAAIRTPDGQIVDDVVADELRAWMGKYGRTGLPVAPGTTVPTSAGEMLTQGVRRIYHVAVAAPRPGTNDYDVEPSAIATGVRNVLTIARSERELFDPPLRTIGFPLLGAGRGGLDPAVSFAWLWPSLERDIRENGPWEIHFISRHLVVAELIATKLAEAGVTAAPPEPR